MEIRLANFDERNSVVELLTQAKLPTDDIVEQTKLFVLKTDNQIIGTGGLDLFGKVGLLRSISVIDSEKGKGYGLMITKEIENFAKSLEIKELYLLTTTAKDFFEGKLNYKVVSRNEVIEPIQQTKQFTGLCPSSAIILKKLL